MSLEFQKYAAKGNEMLKMLAEDLNTDRNKAGRILRAVLHALRNHLTIDESMQLISQLPMALKGVYVDQWNPALSYKRVKKLHDFIDEVRKYDSSSAAYDLGNDEKAKLAVKAVFRVLNYYLSQGEFRDIIAVLPEELKDFIKSSIGEGRFAL